MAAHEKSSLIEYLILGLVGTLGIILVLVGALIQGYWSAVMKDLGDALVIAALVGVFVEIRLVRAAVLRMEAIGNKTVSEIKGMVVRGLRKYLPTKLVDALEQQVLDPIFLREEIKVLITLTHEQDKGRVKGTVFLKYRVRNLSEKSQQYPVRLNLDKVMGDQSAALNRVVIDNKEIDITSLPPGTKLSEEANVLKFEHPLTIAAESGINVELSGYQVMTEVDVWPWYLMGVSDSAEIIVNYPPESLSVWLHPKHPLTASQDGLGLTEALGTTQASINDIILPYQGFELRWKPATQRTASEPVTPVAGGPVQVVVKAS